MMSRKRKKYVSPKESSEREQHSLPPLPLFLFNILIVIIIAFVSWQCCLSRWLVREYAPWPAEDVSTAIILLLVGHFAWRHLNPLLDGYASDISLGWVKLPLELFSRLCNALHPSGSKISNARLTLIVLLSSLIVYWIGLSPLSPLQRFNPPLTIEAFLFRYDDYTLVEPKPGEKPQIPSGASVLVELLPKRRNINCSWSLGSVAREPTPGCSYWYRAPAKSMYDTLSALRQSRCHDASTLASVRIEVVDVATTGSAAKAPRKVIISGLRDGDAVPCRMAVRGRYTEDLHWQIWLLVYVGGRYYPQDDNGRPAAMSNEEWKGLIRFGDCSHPEIDRGKVFQLVVATADKRGDESFRSYLAAARKTGKFRGLSQLPIGVIEQTRVGVRRN